MSDIVTSQFQYIRKREIGAGFFGTVYEVDDPQLLGVFAAKEIRVEEMEDTAYESMFAEAAAMHASRCSHVVEIRAAGRNDKVISFVMPYYKNGSLEKRIANHPLPLSKVIKLGNDILIGLAHIHRAGIIHFDLKPANVLFDDNDRAMISDFGQFSRIKSDGLALSGVTYQFTRAPEVWTSREGGPASDVYQAGVTLYRAVNGEPFYQKQIEKFTVASGILLAKLARAVVNGTFPNRKAYQPHVPASLRRVINRAMNPDVTKRFQNSDEFADALNRVSLPLDWHVEPRKDGGVCWRVDRPKHASIIVDLIHGNGNYLVEVHTENAGRRVQRRRKDFRREFESPDETNQHLSMVFNELP